MTTYSPYAISLVESGFGRPRVLVVGDLMLDKYIWGEVERISPEAPVPVLRAARQSQQPGGAANVAMNLAGLGAQVTVMGYGGGDDDQRALESLLSAAGVSVGMVACPGVPTTSKLRVLADRLHDRAYQLSWPVLDQVLPEAPLRTPTQLAADVDRALLALDPADAAVRLPKALAARHVCHPRRLPDGMAGLWAVLPADDAARIDATLEATARAARAVGDPRTLDQLRADTLTGLATGDALLAGAIAGGESYAADEVGDLDVSRGEGGPPVGRPAPGIRVPKIRIDVTVALSTLMGLDDLPGELAGLGPIPAEQVRAVAAGGIWRRLVTDPLTGAVLDVGRTRYRPPAGLAEHVLARDGSCAAPGCSVASHRCDLDHTTEYYGSPANGSPAPGTTSNDNLGPLSNRCHRLKTDGGFVLRQVEPGVFEWWTPGGMAYRVTPGQHGRTEKLDTRRSRYPEEPPF